jgi:hypothetical protein
MTTGVAIRLNNDFLDRNPDMASAPAGKEAPKHISCMFSTLLTESVYTTNHTTLLTSEHKEGHTCSHTVAYLTKFLTLIQRQREIIARKDQSRGRSSHWRGRVEKEKYPS